MGNVGFTLGAVFMLAMVSVRFGSSLTTMAEPAAYDWPQWRGADRTGVSKETGFLKKWPAAGPTVVWSSSGLGEGYGTVAIERNQIFLQGTRNNESVIYALHRSNGKVVWTKALGPRLEQDRGIWTEGHAYCGWGSNLRFDGKWRLGLSKDNQWGHPLAAQYPEGFQKQKHPMGH